MSGWIIIGLVLWALWCGAQTAAIIYVRKNPDKDPRKGLK